jgi:hypothetical protein
VRIKIKQPGRVILDRDKEEARLIAQWAEATKSDEELEEMLSTTPLPPPPQLRAALKLKIQIAKDKLKPLISFKQDDRVIRRSAERLDFAYNKEGTVYFHPDENDVVGVMWDGDKKIFAYPGTMLFEPAPARIVLASS